MHCIFIDTEFTDFLDIHLISLGLVSSTGEEFYAEVPYPDASCSPFVREVVIPLLGKIPGAAMSKSALKEALLHWLNRCHQLMTPLYICYDFQSDWDLFVDAVDNEIPAWCQPRFIGNQLCQSTRLHFYTKHSLPMHHALYDARANSEAYMDDASPDSELQS